MEIVIVMPSVPCSPVGGMISSTIVTVIVIAATYPLVKESALPG